MGGVEKIILELSREMYSRGHKVTVVSLDRPASESFYEWPVGVAWIRLNVGDSDVKANFLTRIRRIRKIRALSRQLDINVAVGFQIGSFALLKASTIGMKLKCVAAERNAPTLFDFIIKGNRKRLISNLILSTADKISIQLESHRKYYPRSLQSKIYINPNPIVIPATIKSAKSTGGDKKMILYVGRVTYQKNLEVLVDAISKIKENPILRIVGDGESLKSLVVRAQSLGVELELYPFSKELSHHYLKADLFCLPSRWEGFPNVVGEALAHGLPVVGFEECAGIDSLVENLVSGVVASGNDNSDSLALALNSALWRRWDPNVISDSVRKYSMESFSDSWEATFSARDLG